MLLTIIKSSNTVLFILFFVAIIVIGIIWEIFRTKCPNCGKFWARKVISKRTNFDTNFHRGTNSRTTISQCRCKFCNHEWTQRYTSTKRK